MPEAERLPTVLELLAEIDARNWAKIPHSVKRRLPGSVALNSAPSVWMRTESYSSHGFRYARFRWGKGSETWGYVHIAGGLCSTELVQARRSQIDQLIAAGASLDQILALLRGWENARSGRKPKT